MDFALDPVILIKLIHPSYGYLNNFPNAVKYKLTEDSVAYFISELVVASNEM
jgi:hypothetical protein